MTEAGCGGLLVLFDDSPFDPFDDEVAERGEEDRAAGGVEAVSTECVRGRVAEIVGDQCSLPVAGHERMDKHKNRRNADGVRKAEDAGVGRQASELGSGGCV